MKTTFITKASGERERFSEAKLRRSLERSHASQDLIDSIVKEVTKELQDGMMTQQIYARAFSLLRGKERPAAARYSTKAALMELGPSGRPFEKIVGALLAAEGFATEVSVVVSGVCVKHEIDVVAQKGDRCVMVECKFHNQQGTKSDVKISLYIQARFEDVERAWQRKKEHAKQFHEAWLVTNTKLTSDAIAYAECVKMKAIGWSYPSGDGLEARIDRAGLHPITCLTTLNRLQKSELIREGFVLCRELLDNPDALQKVVRNPARTEKVLQEVRGLLGIV